MGIIDTHSHLYAEQFDEDRDEVIKRAFDIGIEKIMLPNIDSSSIEGMFEIEKQYQGKLYAMMGLHPCSVNDNVNDELKLVREWLDRRAFIGVGEIGLDYYWDTTYKSQQQAAFRQQCEWALEFGYPIVIHSRDSTEDVISIIKEYKGDGLRGIFHCFGGSAEEAKEITSLDFYLGIGGVYTFKKAKLNESLIEIPLSKIVFETDSPYLSPTPYRGKRNESSYIQYIIDKFAKDRSLDAEYIITESTKNVKRMFDF